MSSVLQVENINVYYGSIHAVKDVSFHVEQGEVVTLIGANGAGKSTTLNTVAGLLRSRTGSVRFMDEELRHVPSHKPIYEVPHGLHHSSILQGIDEVFRHILEKACSHHKVFPRLIRLFRQVL